MKKIKYATPITNPGKKFSISYIFVNCKNENI